MTYVGLSTPVACCQSFRGLIEKKKRKEKKNNKQQLSFKEECEEV